MKTVKSLPNHGFLRGELMPSLTSKNTISCHSYKTVLPTAPSSSLTDEWLDSPQAAQFLKVTEAQLRNLTSNRAIPYCKLGRSNRYSKNELDTHLRKSRKG